MKEPYKTYAKAATMYTGSVFAWCAVLLALSYGIAYADYTITTDAGTTPERGFNNGARLRIAMPFTTIGTATLASMTASLSWGGNHGSSIITVESDAGGVPANDDLAHMTIADSSLNTDGNCHDVGATLSANPVLSASMQYWVVVSSNNEGDNATLTSVCGMGSLTDQNVKAYDGSWGTTITTIALRDVLNFTEGGGGGGGGTGTTSTSTISYIDNPNENLFNGFVIFFMSWFGVMWILRRRQ